MVIEPTIQLMGLYVQELIQRYQRYDAILIPWFNQQNTWIMDENVVNLM